MINSALVCKRKSTAKKRHYVGASSLGDCCDRKIWYTRFEPAEIKDGRILRIFEIGDLIEAYVIQLLKYAGTQVFEKDAKGEQFGFSDNGVSGHLDGVVVGLPESSKPHVLEIKSMKHSNFLQLQKKGLKAAQIKYYAQMQIYMLKMELENGLMIVMNKDTQELYFERIKLDKLYAKALVKKGQDINKMEVPPPRAWKKPNFNCNMCNHKKECWNDER